MAAAALAAAVSGDQVSQQNNIENLLDIDFDGAAPASAQKSPVGGMSGLEGLAGTPQRVASPAIHNGLSSQPMTGMDDLMKLPDFGGMGGGFADANQDILNGFAGLEVGGSSQPPAPAHDQLGRMNTNTQSSTGNKIEEDLLGLF